MMTLLLLLALAQVPCVPDCPSSRAHPESVAHTAGGACRDCKAKIDVCYRSCTACAAKAGECPGCGGRRLAPLKEWSGHDSRIDKAEWARITAKADWAALWKRNSGSGEAPEVDFSREMVVAILGGVTLHSEGVGRGPVREFEDRLEVRVNYRSAQCGSEPDIQSYLFLKLPRSPKRVDVTATVHAADGSEPPKPLKLATFDPLK